MKAAVIAGGLAALLLTLAAAPALAEAPTVRNDFAQGQNWTVNPSPHRQVQWNAASKWGLKLDMDQPINRDMDWKDVQAGAYFRLTPQLRVGGSVGLGSQLTATPPPRVLPQDAVTPRVHVETAFQF